MVIGGLLLSRTCLFLIFEGQDRFQKGRVTALRNGRIAGRLVELGQDLFQAPKQFVEFTKVREADVLLNDIGGHPHAFVLACVMDRQIKAERAWLIPYKISLKIGSPSFDAFSRLSQEEIKDHMSRPESLHRFVEIMSKYLFLAIGRIQDQYQGDASRIWVGNPSSAELVYRFLEFEGIGPKIATMGANILSREFKIPLSDYFSIDISADVHVRRVFARLGICPEDASVEQVIYKARSLHPEFPGLMDLPCWEIGRQWCKPHNPECGACYMKDICPTVNKGATVPEE